MEFCHWEEGDEVMADKGFRIQDLLEPQKATIFGHLPREFSRIAWYFLARSGEISVEVIGRRRHCKQLCGGMEIPCQLEFNCSNKAQMKRLKELLASKIQV